MDDQMTVRSLIDEAYKTALSKGWYDGSEPNIGERLMLIVSEVAEALEEYRNGLPLTSIYTLLNGEIVPLHVKPGSKPEGFVVELADVMIRIADLAGRHNLPLEQAIQAKLVYNKTRPYRHGGKIV